MYERWTDRARKSIVLAQEHARMLDHDRIGTGHMLLGLLAEGGGVAYQALSALGADLDKARDRLERHEPRGRTPVAGHLPFTPGGKKARERALREALLLGHPYIGTEHVLLGVIRAEPAGTASLILADLGISLPAARAKVLELLGAYDRAGQARHWQRSSFHQPTSLGDCPEVYRYGDGVVGFRDARRPDGKALLFGAETWQAFIAGVKAGEFDFGEVPADGS